MDLTEQEWKNKLGEQRYKVLRQKGTEAPFSGTLLRENRAGMFVCGGCQAELFSSESKYESHLPGLEGWPSFQEAANSDAVKFKEDKSLGMERTEVVCAKCGGHLGHVFENDPDSETGKHYCINSCALDFEPKENK